MGDNMANAVLQRDRHRQYLEQVRLGVREIQLAKMNYQATLEYAEKEMKQAVQYSMTLQLPKKLAEKSNGMCRFEAAAKRISDMDEFGRTLLDGCSFVPSLRKSLVQLKKENIVKRTPDWLEH